MIDDGIGGRDWRLDLIADIFARGLARAFAREERGEPAPPTPPRGKQNFRIVSERVVQENPRIVEVKFEFTRRRQPKPKPPEPPKSKGRLPHVTQQLVRAHQLQKLLDEGKAKSQRGLAKLLGLSPARVTQLMDLLFLAPDLQEKILFLPRTTKKRDEVAERDLRLVANVPAWAEQRALWDDLQSGTRVRILFDAKAKSAAKQRWHVTQQVIRTRRGTLLSMRTRPTPELARRILACGRGVEVLAPESLRKQVAAELKGAASRYE